MPAPKKPQTGRIGHARAISGFLMQTKVYLFYGIQHATSVNGTEGTNLKTIQRLIHITRRAENLGGGGRSFLAVFQSKTMLNSPYRRTTLPCQQHLRVSHFTFERNLSTPYGEVQHSFAREEQ
jgi:hypothetical protein